MTKDLFGEDFFMPPDLQIELAISKAFGPEDQDVDDASSEAIAATTGRKQGIRVPSEWNMPIVPSQYDLLQSQKAGKYKKDKLKFKWRDAWLWLPKQFEAEFRAKVFEKDNVTCTFQWKNGSFYCTILESGEASALLESGATSPGAFSSTQDAGQPATTMTSNPKKGMWLIPVSTKGHTIKDAGVRLLKGKNDTCFVDIPAGVFNLPASISLYLLALAEERNTPKDVSFLRGCSLIRPNEARMAVTGHGNQEPYISIVSDTGKIIVEQRFTRTKSSLKKREREPLGAERNQSDEGAESGEPAAKMQRAA